MHERRECAQEPAAEASAIDMGHIKHGGANVEAIPDAKLHWSVRVQRL